VSIVLVAHTGAASADGNNVTTSAVDTTGANLLVALVGLYEPGIPGPTDSLGNIYVPFPSYSDSTGNFRLRLWYCNNPRVGPGFTWSVATAEGSPSICGAAFSLSSGQFFADSYSGENSDSPGAIIPAQPGELFATGTISNGGPPYIVNSGFALLDSTTYVNNIAQGIALAWLVNPSLARIDPVWTASTALACTQAAFKFTGSTPPTPPSPPPEMCSPAPIPSYNPGLVADQEPPELTGS
jgi:hypothetical protein